MKRPRSPTALESPPVTARNRGRSSKDATNTRERILNESLALFNERGERSVTTNHIASHLGISPGHLYYYFDNKLALIAELFDRYIEDLSLGLQIPAGRPLTLEDKLNYDEHVFQATWRFRFFHLNYEHLIAQSDDLRRRYSALTSATLKSARGIYAGLREAGLLKATDEELDALAVNAWVIISAWPGMIQATLHAPAESDAALLRLRLRQGVYQLLRLEAPYLCGRAAAELDSALAEYRSGVAPPYGWLTW